MLRSKAVWASQRRRILFYRHAVLSDRAHSASHPEQSLHWIVYIDGSFEFFQSVSLGGASGNVTLAVGGDLTIDPKLTVANMHDLSTVARRRTPAIVVLGTPNPTDLSTKKWGQHLNWLGAS